MSMTNGILDKISTHKEDALKRLLEQYKNTENIPAIIGIYSDQIQEIEDEINIMLETKNRLDINNSEGIQLDKIGEIVDQPRGSSGDARYRQLIFIKIGINTSEGTPERIIQILQLLTSANYIHYLNLGGAEMDFELPVDLGNQDDINILFLSLNAVIAAGTRITEIKKHKKERRLGSVAQVTTLLFLVLEMELIKLKVGKFSDPKRFALPFAFSDANGKDTDASTDGFGAGVQDPFLGGEFVA